MRVGGGKGGGEGGRRGGEEVRVGVGGGEDEEKGRVGREEERITRGAYILCSSFPCVHACTCTGSRSL